MTRVFHSLHLSWVMTFYWTENLYTVRELNVSPGFNTVDGNEGSFRFSPYSISLTVDGSFIFYP